MSSKLFVPYNTVVKSDFDNPTKIHTPVYDEQFYGETTDVAQLYWVISINFV